jgi:hypothetical protein
MCLIDVLLEWLAMGNNYICGVVVMQPMALQHWLSVELKIKQCELELKRKETETKTLKLHEEADIEKVRRCALLLRERNELQDLGIDQDEMDKAPLEYSFASFDIVASQLWHSYNFIEIFVILFLTESFNLVLQLGAANIPNV